MMAAGPDRRAHIYAPYAHMLAPPIAGPRFGNIASQRSSSILDAYSAGFGGGLAAGRAARSRAGRPPPRRRRVYVCIAAVDVALRSRMQQQQARQQQPAAAQASQRLHNTAVSRRPAIHNY
jgi:hypothetical protein